MIVEERLNNIFDRIEYGDDLQAVLPPYIYNKYGIVCFDNNGNLRPFKDILDDVSKIYWDLSRPGREDLRNCIYGLHCSKREFESYI